MGLGFQYHKALLTQLGYKAELVIAKFPKDAFELLQSNILCEN